MSLEQKEPVKVAMGESQITDCKITTDGLGPCISFLLIFKYMEKDKAVLIHYSHSMKKKKRYKYGVFEQLIQIIEHIISQTTMHFPHKTLITNNQSLFSDCELVVAGGDAVNGKWIHEALVLLNRNLNFPIESICNNGDVCFLYYQLLNRVTIFKFVSKMSNSESDKEDDEKYEGENEQVQEDNDDDEDEEENEQVQGDNDDDEKDEEENEQVQEDGDKEMNGRNEYSWIFFRYSVPDKELSLMIEWAACKYTGEIGILNMHLHENVTHVRWELQRDNIQKFKQICQHDQALLDCLKESVDLIPTDDPFVTSPSHPNQLKIGINGFDRIGQIVFYCALMQGVQVVGVNDAFIHAGNKIDKFRNYLTHGKFKCDILYEDGKLVVNRQQITIYTEREPSKIPWDQRHTEYVVESTGMLTTLDECQPYIQAGAKKVIMTAQSMDVPIFVVGVNHEKYTGKETILSSASCTTNCLAPLAKVIHEKFGIDRGSLVIQSSFELGRSTPNERSNQNTSSECGSAQDMNISSSDVAEAMGKIIPDLNGKLTCTIDRVPPTSNVSVVSLTIQLEKKVTYEEICAAIKEAANGPLKGILAYTNDEIVATDLIVNTHSSIFDAKAGNSLNDNLVKLVAWCNNEYGYSHRIINLIKYIDVIEHLTSVESAKQLVPSRAVD